jgi:hypothetical protein
MNLATNAEFIIAARMKGKAPADMVIVSMVGPIVTENPIVFANAAQKFDWRWVRGLDVCVYMDADVDWQALLMDIAVQRPAHLSLWDHGAKWGTAVYLIPRESDLARPMRYWKYEMDFLPWMDFQNDDFAVGRAYARNEYGVPYALGKRQH